MNEFNQMNRDLLMLTYAAQFDHPMSAGARNVLEKLIEPKYPLQQEDYYLAIIQNLLSSDTPLFGAAPSVEGRSEDEIREFLSELANALEDEYGFSRRGGRVATYSGRWICVSSGTEGTFSVGEVLPICDEEKGIWVYQPESGARPTWGVLKEELARYYRPKFLRVAAGNNKPTQPYAEVSYSRMRRVLQQDQMDCLKKDLSRLLAEDKSKWSELNSSLGNSSSNPDVHDWLMRLFSELALKIS